MTADIFLVLFLLAAAVLLFATEWLSVDIVTLLLLIALVLTGILTPQEAFSGFASEIIIILASIFVLSGALLKTGVMDWLGAFIERVAGNSRVRILLLVMMVVSLTSAFMNNTTVTAVFLPAVLGICRRSRISPGQMLIPLAYASILGGTCTLIGTSTNVAASGYLQRVGLAPISLFEFLPVGIIMVLAGTLYMSLLGHRFLPQLADSSLTEEYEIKEYLSEILIIEGSPVAGRTIREAPFDAMGLTVLEILRGSDTIYPEPHTLLQENDLLIVQGSRESLLLVKEASGVQIKADVKLGDTDLITETVKIGEAIIMPQSVLIDRTLKEVNFRQRFGVTALAIYRRGHAVPAKLGKLALRVGDVLLLQGRPEQFESILGNTDLWVLEQTDHVPFRKRKGTYAVLIFLLAVLAGGFQLLPLPIAFLLAAVIAILLKCITVEEAYNFMDWRLIILIAGMTSFGLAMEQTETAGYLADLIIRLMLPYGIYFVMAGFMALTILLTQPMANASAALVVLPVAVQTAVQLDVDPRNFAILVTLSASLSLIAPFEPSCILVYGTGKYRFRDFVMAGFPLTLLAFILLLVLVPILWPLKG